MGGFLILDQYLPGPRRNWRMADPPILGGYGLISNSQR